MIAEAGIASRRVADDLVRQGRVTVNGRRAELGLRVDPDTDVIEVDGSRLPTKRGKRYVMLNKPKGVITTARDPEGRPTAVGMIPSKERLFSVGRLDADTEGLLLLTNDGELTNLLTHPSYEVPKVYVAEVDGSVTPTTIRKLKEGVRIGPGRKAQAMKVRIKGERGRSRTVLEMTIHEGRKHVVRRMLDEVGHPVRRLVRTQIGGLRIGNLRPGAFRELTLPEVADLYRQPDK